MSGFEVRPFLVALPYFADSDSKASWRVSMKYIKTDQKGFIADNQTQKGKGKTVLLQRVLLQERLAGSTCFSLFSAHSDTSRPTNNNSGRIVVERTPFVPDRGKHLPLLTLCSANVRAVKSKTAALLEYIHSADMDIFAVTETWLTDKDAAAKMEFIPTETHKFVQCNQLYSARS